MILISSTAANFNLLKFAAFFLVFGFEKGGNTVDKSDIFQQVFNIKEKK